MLEQEVKKKKFKKPINKIERKDDADLKWRKKVNHNLKTSYKKLFNKIDKLIFLKAPSFNHIFQWRIAPRTKIKIDIKK